MSDFRPLTRSQLGKFLPDPRAVKAFEQLLANTAEVTPEDITAIQINSDNAVAVANEALSLISDLLLKMEPVPTTKTGDFTLDPTDSLVINNKSGSTCVVTLPDAIIYPGRQVTFQNYQDEALISASSDVVPRGGGAAGTEILDDVAGNWATLVSDGTNWVIMKAAPYNSMLLE